eukprot:TRINITY_DN596_c0_g1_i1.p2 TRINITY_DN596_c0_g1~~TRINITY_DN596_c0_g1_i1.p2  ORF type:complete len:105 (-),score=2.17 TRINITY_DN596_c0_g1_i1:414-728(-)
MKCNWNVAWLETLISTNLKENGSYVFSVIIKIKDWHNSLPAANAGDNLYTIFHSRRIFAYLIRVRAVIALVIMDQSHQHKWRASLLPPLAQQRCWGFLCGAHQR